MREILFRGKGICDGEWMFGSLVKVADECVIIAEDAVYYGGSDFSKGCAVDPATVGQFTGLTDADGIPIFEGDMFEPYDDEFDKSVVEFRNGAFRVVTYGITGAMMPYGWDETAGGYGELDEHDLIDWVDCGVIGNIHDNPEMLEGGCLCGRST